jgi:hypothetical protein
MHSDDDMLAETSKGSKIDYVTYVTVAAAVRQVLNKQ